jgi:hypothetical protein
LRNRTIRFRLKSPGNWAYLGAVYDLFSYRDLDQGTVIRHFTQRGETVDELWKRLGIG